MWMTSGSFRSRVLAPHCEQAVKLLSSQRGLALVIPSIGFAAGLPLDSGPNAQTVQMSSTKYVTINPGGGVIDDGRPSRATYRAR